MNFLRRSLGATFNAPRNWISAGVLAIASWTTPCRAAGSDAAPFDDLEYLAAVECPTRDGLLVRLRQAVRAAPTPSHQWGKLKLTIARPSSPSGNYEGSLRLNEDLPRLLKGSACGEIVNAVIVIVKIWAREATLPSKVAVVELRSLGVAAEKSGTQITATDSPVLQPKGAATEQLPASPTSASPRRHENRGTRLKMAVVAPHQTKRRSPDEFAHQTNGSSLADEFAHQTNGSSLADEFAHQTNGSSL
ncbi:MAG TPA: hypothetical protein VKP30_26265, partial [Polyangiaceae bacterium]|nr:hypothetical protein [Polyangiaceae bacterium]